MKIKSVHLFLFLLGLVSFACYFLLPGRPRYLIVVGWLAWLSAYLGILAKCYKKNVPIPTSMGRLEKEKRPGLYKLMYLWLIFVGVFAVFVSLVITLFH